MEVKGVQDCSAVGKAVSESKRKKTADGKAQLKAHEDEFAWDGWGEYMNEKQRKLREQYRQDASAAGSGVQEEVHKSEIFRGVSIFINGRTQPPALELKRLIGIHGGAYEHYDNTNATVTHTIATNLPTAKIRQLTGREKIMKPEWITDSIKAGKLLPEDGYRLYVNIEGNPQKSILSFGQKRKAENPPPDVDSQVSEFVPETQESEANDASQTSPRSEELNRAFVEYYEMIGTDMPKTLAKQSKSPTQKTELRSGHIHGDPNDPAGFAMARINTIGDPNFIKHYYNTSRLSFLSRWGAEVRKIASDAYEEKLRRKREAGVKEKISQDSNEGRSRWVAHFDMDCFFASVYIRDHPELKDKPVAVCHSIGDRKRTATRSDGFVSTSEVAACNYIARSFGIANGEFLGGAREKCPELVTVPYDFDGYRETSKAFYRTIIEFADEIQAVSCDEAFIDLSAAVAEAMSKHDNDPTVREEQVVADVVRTLREQIHEATGCPCSAGIGSSMLIARLATREGKPDGQHIVTPSEAADFIAPRKVNEIPGVGWRFNRKFRAWNVDTIGDLRTVSKDKLQEEFGLNQGQIFWEMARGIDKRPLKTIQERKSVSAEINWGVRFTEDHQVEKFLRDLSAEVTERLNDVRLAGRSMCLRIMARRMDVVQSHKFLGHGSCDVVTRTKRFMKAVRDVDTIASSAIPLWKDMKLPPNRVRGVGIQITKLENPEEEMKKGIGKWIKRKDIAEAAPEAPEAPEATEASEAPNSLQPVPSEEDSEERKRSPLKQKKLPTAQTFTFPTESQVDMEVWEQLPDDVKKDVLQTMKRSRREDNEGASSAAFICEESGATSTEAQNTDTYQGPFAKKQKKGKQSSLYNHVLPQALIDEFAASKGAKLDTEQTQILALLKQEGIDRDVWMGLPDDIKAELLQDIRQRHGLLDHGTRVGGNQPSTRTGLSTSPSCHQHQAATGQNIKEIADSNEDDDPGSNIRSSIPPALGNARDPQEVLTLIHRWTQEVTEPNAEEIDAIVTYIKALVMRKQLDDATVVLKRLRRYVNVMADDRRLLWHEACNVVVAAVNDEVARQFEGATLLI
eukprot:Clim_evm22s237 gene=Clim_evmTU22s237